MGNLYQGQARPSAAADSPQPAPSQAAPTILNPVDADGTGVANRSDPQYRLGVDELAWIKAAIKLCPPILPASAGSGYSAVTYSSFGGTITPSGDGSTYNSKSGTNFVILITVGGARGTAKFKVSIDGGNTYGAEQTTAASLTDATTGITIAFSNSTFTLNGTAQFHSALTALSAWADAAANVRYLIDRNGFPTHRLTSFFWDWNGASSNNGIPAGLGLVTGAGGAATATAPSSTYPAPQLLMQPGTTNASVTDVGSQNTLVFPASVVDCVLQFEAKLGQSGGAMHSDVGMGMSASVSIVDPTATNALLIRKLFNEANWKLVTCDGAAQNLVDTNIVSDTNWHRFRLEYHGSSTALGAIGGAVVLAYIDEVLVAASLAHLPGAALFLAMTTIARNTPGATDSITFGSGSFTANRWLTVPTF